MESVEELVALPDGTPGLPLSRKIASISNLHPGKKVRVTVADRDYLMVKVA